MTRTLADIHGITPAMAAGGFYIHDTAKGRKVALSTRTHQLMRARGAAVMASARETIGSLDKAIDANRRELRKRAGLRGGYTAGEAQTAWDAHPDLRDRENELFRQRGFAQLERDDAEARKAALAARRTVKMPPKCPACRGTGYAARKAA